MISDNFKVKGNDFDPEFDSGISYLIRLNNLFNQATFFKVNNNFKSLYNTLEVLQLELAPRMNEAQLESVESLHKECNKIFGLTLSGERNLNVVSANNKFFAWFEKLSILHHALGLSMKTKKNTISVLDDTY